MDTPSTVLGLCRKIDNDDVIGERILVLDNVQDPGNLGTIIRSALAFNVSTIILSENTVDLYNPKVLRATQGMLFHMNIISRDVVNWLSTIAPLGIPIYGTKVDGGFDPRKLSKTEKKKFVLIVGNEGNGVSSRVLDLCSKNLCIPTNIRVESLNVAVATSILLYELGN